MEQNENTQGAGEQSSRSKFFAVVTAPDGKPSLLEANSKRDLAKALAAEPGHQLVAAIRGKRLQATEKKTVHFS